MTTGNKVVRQLTTTDYSRKQLVPALPLVKSSTSYIHWKGKQWVGGDDKTWKQKIAAGLDATNSYDFTVHNLLEVKDGRHTCEYVYIDTVPTYKQIMIVGSGIYFRDLSAENAVDLPRRASVTNKANIKLLKKLNDRHNAINAFSFAGELAKTIHSIRHPAESLAELATTYAQNVALNKKRFARNYGQAGRIKHNAKRIATLKRLRRQERTLISNLWLEYRFGVLPLLGDIESVADSVLNSRNISKRDIITATASEAGPDKVLSTDTVEFVTRRQTNTKIRYKCKVKLIAEIELERKPPESLGRLVGNAISTELGQIVPAVWDLLPLSVFLDYFVNVNDVLTAAVTTTGDVVRVQRQVRETVLAENYTTISSRPQVSYTDLKPPKLGITSNSKTHYLRERWQLAIPQLALSAPISGKPIRLANLAAFINNVLSN